MNEKGQSATDKAEYAMLRELQSILATTVRMKMRIPSCSSIRMVCTFYKVDFKMITDFRLSLRLWWSRRCRIPRRSDNKWSVASSLSPLLMSWYADCCLQKTGSKSYLCFGLRETREKGKSFQRISLSVLAGTVLCDFSVKKSKHMDCYCVPINPPFASL